jgi:hypothetical protein
MKGQYTIKGNKLIGTLSLCDLKVWADEFNDSCITIKNRTGGVLVLRQVICTRKMPKYSYGNSWTRVKLYILNGTETTEKFSDIAKVLIKKGFTKGFSLVKFDCEEIVDADGEIIDRNNAVLAYDAEEYVRQENAYYCETDGEWYVSTDDLILIDGNYYRTDDPDVSYCDRCDEYFIGDGTEVHVSRSSTEMWCDSCVDNDAFRCDDCGEYWSSDEAIYVDRPNSTVCPECCDEDYCYCEECGRTIHIDYWNGEYECCDDCAEEKYNYVKPYHWHHSNSYENKYQLFMPKGKMVRLGTNDEVRTCGLELEVSKDSTDGRDETIEQLLDLPLKENEIFFEHDGSLDNGGFEIITGVHTFESLKSMPWDSILKILSENGYRSHNGGLCGLHIHIGRKFFGKTENAQNNAIGKIYAFYNLFWKDIVKVSRRERFTYCDNPYEELEPETLYSFIKNRADYTYKLLLKKAEKKDGSHGLALNNRNDNTFEFRLGRGTLKYESFMAWVDFTFTIAKNARKISTRKLDDCDAWLNGISKETAMYIKSKGAFTGSTIIENLTNGGIVVCA